MYVRQRNPLWEAKQLQADNVEDVAEWCGLNRTHILWSRSDSGEGEPRLASNGDDSIYAYLGDWIVRVSQFPSRYQVFQDDMFQREFVADLPFDHETNGGRGLPQRRNVIDRDKAIFSTPLGSIDKADFTIEDLFEVDRNARAYGYEIGKGANFADVLHMMSEDNPFLNKDWRQKVRKVEDDAG